MTNAVLVTKICFIIGSFLEALIAGMIPTFSSKCRESPKVLGIANAFAGGVFLAIALMHIMPEQIAAWNELKAEQGVDEPFPMAELLCLLGYTTILLIDKVMFDTSALFDEDNGHSDLHDPADRKLEVNMRASMAKTETVDASDPTAVRNSMQKQVEGIEDAMKGYLNPHDRFATRMRASLKGSGIIDEGVTSEEKNAQEELFVDKENVDLENITNITSLEDKKSQV